MDAMTITPIQARKAWSNADNKGKNLLENLFGKDKFQEKDITDIIKTVDDAYDYTGNIRVDYSCVPESRREYIQAVDDAIVIVEALNEGWYPDWDNNDEPKWIPWFIMGPSAFAFSCSYYANSRAFAGSGSRLRLKSKALSDYFAKQFPDICKKIQLG